MHAHEPRTALRRQFESCVPHADWCEQPFCEILSEPLSADALDRLADPIDIDAVIPSVAGIEDQRQGKCAVLAGDDVRRTSLFDVASDIGIPDPVDEPGGV